MEGARILCYRINSSIEYNLLKNGQSARVRNHYFMIRIRIKVRTDLYPLNTGRRTLAKSGRISHLSISTSFRILPSSSFSSFFPFGSSLVVGSRTNGSRKMAIGFSIIPINISPMMRTVCQ